jgi:hypothetical protein
MQYMLLVYVDEKIYQQSSPEENSQRTAAYMAYAKSMQDAGVLAAASRLKSVADATTVRFRDGKRQVQDGPFAETREQLGGFFVINVPDLDIALTWAERCPGAGHGTVEVRPVWQGYEV